MSLCNSGIGDLLYYGGVEWLNISDFLGKIKKGLELHAMCFVFKSAVVFLCKERLRQKKKLMVSNAFQAQLRCLAPWVCDLGANNERAAFSAGCHQQEYAERGRDYTVPGADTGDRGASAHLIRQGHGLTLPVGIDSLALATATTLRKGVRAVQQHRRLPQCIPENHSADNTRERSQHVDSDEGHGQHELGGRSASVAALVALQRQFANIGTAQAANRKSAADSYSCCAARKCNTICDSILVYFLPCH